MTYTVVISSAILILVLVILVVVVVIIVALIAPIIIALLRAVHGRVGKAAVGVGQQLAARLLRAPLALRVRVAFVPLLHGNTRKHSTQHAAHSHII